jgi:CHAT domain-containing protein
MSGSIGALRERMDSDDRKLLDEFGENNSQLPKLVVSGPGKVPEHEYKERMAAFEERGEKLEAAISARSVEFRARSQPVTLAAVQAAIPVDAALIEFASFRPFDPRGNESSDAYQKPRYVAYVLRRDGEVRWKDLGPAKETDDAIAAFREALGDSRHADVKTLARTVDERIMQPVRGLAGDATHLLISPDGPLNLIPFEALVDEQGRFLIERYGLSYLTSGRDCYGSKSSEPP